MTAGSQLSALLAEWRYTASADIVFPRVSAFLTDILDSVATHDMEIRAFDDGHVATCPFGIATLVANPGSLRLSVGTDELDHLNRLKHALAGPIGFIASSESLKIDWEGDAAGPTLPRDLRVLHVRSVTDISPRFRRIVFSGEELARYDRPDQIHCRLLFQPRGTADPRWPFLDDNGRIVWPASGALPSRVYTIRAIDRIAQTITIDFFLHEAMGPATRWAMEAGPGSMVGILGPAANGLKAADWYVLAGDETGLPGIARLLGDMPTQARGIALIEVGDRADEQPLKHPEGVELRWFHRGAMPASMSTLLVDAVRACIWPKELQSRFFWGGCEHKAFRALHRYLKGELRLPRDRRVLYSHWHQGMSEPDIVAAGAEAYLP